MKTKNFLVSGLVGGIVNFFLGWVFYMFLFKDYFPNDEPNDNSVVFIFLGALTFGLFVAYIYTKWAQITTISTGAKAGAIIGLFIALHVSFFHLAFVADATFQLAALDTGISIVMSAIMGAVIGVVNGKLG